MMVDPEELQEVLRETLKCEFKQLRDELLHATRLELQSAQQAALAESKASHAGNMSPTSELVQTGYNSQLAQTLKSFGPMGEESSVSGGAASTPQRNFLPIRTYKLREYRDWLLNVDEAVDQKLPAVRQVKDDKDASTRVEAWQAPQASTVQDSPRASGAAQTNQPVEPGTFAHPSAPDTDANDTAEGMSSPPQPPFVMNRGGTKYDRADVAMGLTPKDLGHLGHMQSPLQRKVGQVVRNPYFETFSALMILGSAAHFGLQTDYMAQHLLSEPPPGYRAFDVLFLLFFVLEVSLRLFVYRRRFFVMWGWGWNVLDLLLVAMQVLEEVLLLVVSSDSKETLASGFSASFMLRVARVLRAVRVVRVLHVMRFAEELRLLVSCILHSSKSFFWAAVLLMLMVYVCGVHFTHLVLLKRIDTASHSDASKELELWYGRVPRAVLSLFQGLTGGVDWNDLVDPLIKQISPYMGFAFFMYISFAILAVMNVVTATFVQQAIERAIQVKEVQKVSQASRLFRAIDVNQSGYITFEEIQDHLEMDEVKEFFRSIDVDLTEARCLFDMLDTDDSGSIEFSEFLSGCMRLQGPAKAIDLVLVMRELKEALSRGREVR